MKDGECVRGQLAPRGFPWAPNTCVVFIHTCGKEQKVRSSYRNDAQVRVVSSVVERLLDGGDVGKEQVGIVTWYQAQQESLAREAILRGCTIANVDGFQGSERDVMVISTVRCNSNCEIGFAKDGKRLNVALTRAKRGLIVVGNYHTLISDDVEGFWTAWFKNIPITNDEGRRLAVKDLELQAFVPKVKKVAKVEKDVVVSHGVKKVALWQRNFKWSDVAKEKVEEDRHECVRNMWDTVDRLMRLPLWAKFCSFVLSLKKHSYTVEERPDDFHHWDRKAWSHMNVIVALGVQVDPGNRILYFTLRAILLRMRVCKVDSISDPDEQRVTLMSKKHSNTDS